MSGESGLERPSHHSDHGDPNAFSLLDRRAAMPVLELARSSRRLRLFNRGVFSAFLLSLVGLVVLPWQQFVQGAGRVVAYNPLDRSVVVEAPLAGRVRVSRIVEGQFVRRGDVLFELADNDPNLLANLRMQKEAARERRDAAGRRIEGLDSQVTEIERALPLAVASAQTRLDSATFAANTARLQLDRIQGLYRNQRGLASQRDYELAVLERDRTAAELVRAQAELERAGVDQRAVLGTARAQRDSAKGDLASAEQSLVTLDIQVQQTERQHVVSPRDGIVYRVLATEGTFLRAGSPLCTVIPNTDQRMVEIWVSGNDMPLIRAREIDEVGNVVQPGSPVRIQFEGWPAIQFVGWPSAAIGTFGGEVVLVDPTDNGQGRFRLLVAEKPDVLRANSDDPRVLTWPGARWLRQGVRAHGWVLLQRVPLWFEVWRQMNGFPPALDVSAMAEAQGKK